MIVVGLHRMAPGDKKQKPIFPDLSGTLCQINKTVVPET